MTLRGGALVLVAALVGVLGPATLTANAARYPGGGSGDDDQRAVDLLNRSAAAMRTTSYSGTRVLSAWGHDDATTVMVDVEHVAGQGTTMSMRGGGVSEETATFLASGGDTATSPGGLGVPSFGLLTESYAVTLGGDDVVAGLPSTVVVVSRAGAVAARLWIDDRFGLLLRREVYDRAGRLVRETAFIDVAVDTSGFMAHLPPTPPEPAAHGVGVGSRLALQAAGWACPREAGTMRLVAIEVLRGSDAMHMTYSDGLTRMSVFEQRGSLDPASVRGFERVRIGSRVLHVREGMPTYAMWEDAGLVFTAVTDGPLHTVTDVAVTGPPGPPAAADGFWTRVGSGLTRLGAWATPLL